MPMSKSGQCRRRAAVHQTREKEKKERKRKNTPDRMPGTATRQDGGTNTKGKGQLIAGWQWTARRWVATAALPWPPTAPPTAARPTRPSQTCQPPPTAARPPPPALPPPDVALPLRRALAAAPSRPPPSQASAASPPQPALTPECHNDIKYIIYVTSIKWPLWGFAWHALQGSY